MDAVDVLQKYFGYSSFRGNQDKIIAAILSGKDVMAILPTGGGKSLCYQIPALMLNGLTVVVSPLISLMDDQVKELTQRNICGVCYNSTLSVEQKEEVVRKIQHHEVKVLFVAPETLLTQHMKTLITQVPISLLAIDEAHCVSMWGHDFRPSYLDIAPIREIIGYSVPLLALTASATYRVREDIKALLDMSYDSLTFMNSFDRPNLYMEINQDDHLSISKVIDTIHSFPKQAGIVYCSTREMVETVARNLQDYDIKAVPYHAGLDPEIKAQYQKDFVENKVSVVVATIAFGMGINKPDIRFVIHMSLPRDLESYYQEIGRAGRDGLPSKCIMYYSSKDISNAFFFLGRTENEDKKYIDSERLERMISFVKTKACRRKSLLNHFSEAAHDHCNNCDVCKGE